jgi:dihydrofolate reductase
MRKLIVTEFLTLDGIVEAPERWMFDYHAEQTAQFKVGEMRKADALVLGRRTYNILADSWPAGHGDLADRINPIRKHVVTANSTAHLEWHNSEAITGDPIAALAALKNQHGADLLIAQSASLVQPLTPHRLVDEYRFLLCPLLRGGGQRLLTTDGPPARLTLAESRAFDTGAVLLRYEAA